MSGGRSESEPRIHYSFKNFEEYLDFSKFRTWKVAVNNHCIAVASTKTLVIVDGDTVGKSGGSSVQTTVVDRSSGCVRCSLEFHETFGEPLCIEWVTGAVLCLGFESGVVLCVDLDGNTLLEQRFHPTRVQSLSVDATNAVERSRRGLLLSSWAMLRKEDCSSLVQPWCVCFAVPGVFCSSQSISYVAQCQ